MSVEIRVQPTPNPNSVLFHVDRTVIEERMKQFNSGDDAAGSPLAQALFAIVQGGVDPAVPVGLVGVVEDPLDEGGQAVSAPRGRRGGPVAPLVEA